MSGKAWLLLFALVLVALATAGWLLAGIRAARKFAARAESDG